MGFENPCGLCGGPGGQIPGGGHTVHCPRYQKPRRRRKTI